MGIKLPEFMKSLNDEPEHGACDFLLYVPPSGSAVECPSEAAAIFAASAYAARHPGKVVAVYKRIGQAFVAYKEPQFTPAGELLSAESAPQGDVDGQITTETRDGDG